MKITFSPQRLDAVISVSTRGDVLTINGDDFDFTELPDGAMVPAGEVPCVWIAGPVERVGGVLCVTLILPHASDPTADLSKPVTVNAITDGPVDLPGQETQR